MLKRILFILCVCGTAMYAADSPPPGPSVAGDMASSESIKQLLEATQARKLIDSAMAQMDTLMKEAMQQATHGRKVSPKIQKDIDKRQEALAAMLKDMLDWNKLEPMYLRVYQKSFTQQEVEGMLAFYKTPAGQAVISKMPVVMQNTMNEMQQMMTPMVQKIQKMQQEVVAELKAEGQKKGGS